MGDVLLYQTSDEEFAVRIIAALEDAGIACCRTGFGYKLPTIIGKRILDNGVSIFVQHEHDYQRANQIIVALGAYVEPPVRPVRLLEIGLALAVLAIIVVVAFNL
jgi:hypothetical protein